MRYLSVPICIIMMALASCDRSSGKGVRLQVEVSPDSFLPVRVYGDDDTMPYGYTMSLRYAGRDVAWKGLGAPVVLREFNNRLYMIVFDRLTNSRKIKQVGRGKTFLRYYRLERGQFEEIQPSGFPPGIAVENMILYDWDRDAILHLDTTSPYFRSSLTATAWREIQTGEPMGDTNPTEPFLKDYVERHHPVVVRPASRLAAR